MDETRFPPFAVTRSAIHKIGELGAVRISLQDGGCCGTTYVYDAPQDPEAGDAECFGCPGAWLVVDPEAVGLLEGATLDYGARLKPPRFRVTSNPNTPEVCPCRRSFGSAWPGPRQPTCRAYRPMPWDDDYEPPLEWARRTGFRR